MSLSKEEGDIITIPLLGRHARLGFLYDERRDVFGGSVFKREVTGNAIKKTDKSLTEIKFVYDDTNQEKFDLYNIDAKIQVNLLSGMLPVKGSAAYLKEEKKSTREVKGLMLYECYTAVEDLQIGYEELKDEYNLDEINRPGFTHVVTELTWGGKVAISFSQKFDEENDKQKVKGCLEVVFEKAKSALAVEGKANADLDFTQQGHSKQFALNMKGDIRIPDEIPKTYEGVQELIRQVPKLIQRSDNNGGKGVALECKLTPLAHLRKQLNQINAKNEFVKQLSESTLNDIIRTFDKVSEASQKLYDLANDVELNSVCIVRETLNEMRNYTAKFTSSKIRFQEVIKEAIIAERSGLRCAEKDKSLSDIIEAYVSGDFSPASVERKLECSEFLQAIRKIAFKKSILKSFPKMAYFGYECQASLDTALMDDRHIIYVLYLFPNSSKATGGDTLRKLPTNFNHSFNKFFVVDCEFEFEQSINLKRTVIQQIINGKITIEDVGEALKSENKSDREIPCMKMKALGRYAKMGQLYNARSDTFLEDRYLFAGVPQSHIQVKTQSGHVETNTVHSENTKDKFKSLAVEPELQYSILSEIISLSKSGEYLQSQAYYPRQSFVHLRRLNEESISISDQNLIKHFQPEALTKGATHFVTKIEYGFQSVFSVEKESNDGTNDEKKIREKVDQDLKMYAEELQNILKRIKISNNSNTGVRHRENSNTGDRGRENSNTGDRERENSNCNCVVEADLKNLQGEFCVKIFSDIHERRYSAKGIQNLLFYLNEIFLKGQMELNNGKGYPIAYVLHPIANLDGEIGILSPCIPFARLNEGVPNSSEFIDILDTIALAKNQIHQMSSFLEKNRDDFRNQDFATLANVKEKFNSTRRIFREEFKDLILSVKNGTEHKNKIQKCLLEYKNCAVFDNKENSDSAPFCPGMAKLKTFLASGADNGDIVQNLENLSCRIRSIEFEKTMACLTGNGIQVKNLERGGLISLPCESHTAYFKYTVDEKKDEEELCLWTFYRKYSNANEVTTLRISLIGDNLNGSLNSDILGLYEWHPFEELSFFDLRSKIGNFASENNMFHYFLYFYSKRCNVGTQFLIKVDVVPTWGIIGIFNNLWFNEVPGNFNLEFPALKGATGFKQSWSIPVLPSKHAPLEFTVERWITSEGWYLYNPVLQVVRAGKFMFGSSDCLDVYELGERGKPKLLGRLNADTKAPVSYTTKHPILALFSTRDSCSGTIKLSWK